MTKNLVAVDFLEKHNITYKLIKLVSAPRNAQAIADAYGCSLGCIIKTLFFSGDKNVIVCVPGDKAVDIAALKTVVFANKLHIASKQEVVELTGLKVGGVNPFFESSQQVIKILDEDCLIHDTVNIGAGDPLTGVELSSANLKKVWPGLIAKISTGLT